MKIFLFLMFFLISCSDPGLARFPKRARPNLSDSTLKKVYSTFSKKDFFTINASKMTFISDNKCISLFCSNNEDCSESINSELYCPFESKSIHFNFMMTNYKSFYEKMKIEEKLLKDLPTDYDVYVDPPLPSAVYKVGIYNKGEERDNSIDVVDYVSSRLKNYKMSSWLKSLNCQSMNFIMLLKSPNAAKTIIDARYTRSEGKLFLEIWGMERGAKKIEIDESTREMKYVTNDWLNRQFRLYSHRPIDLKAQQIKAINFCESFHQF